MLEIRNVDLFYGDAQALDQVSLEVGEAEVVAIVGANGAGKSSLIRTIFGMHRPARGEIRFQGSNLVGEPPHRICDLGIGQVAEGRQIFPSMTVGENLEMGAVVPRARSGAAAAMARILDLFPRLRERFRQRAGTLSGGEQQMLAIARALMSRPRLLLLDEPSLGLAPLIVKQIFDVIREINERQRMTVLLVEQNAYHALRVAHRGYVMQTGRIALSGTGRELLANPEVRAAYLEGGRH